MPYIITAIIAYLIGSINFSILISKKMAGFDVREKGSGNAGTTNVLRAVGKKAAAITLLADVLKGIVAVLLAFFMGKIVSVDKAILVQIAAIAVVVRTHFPTIFSIQRRKRNCDKFGNFTVTQLGNRLDLFAICLDFDGDYENGVVGVYFSSCLVPNTYALHPEPLFS